MGNQDFYKNYHPVHIFYVLAHRVFKIPAKSILNRLIAPSEGDILTI
jgi:hypothetical protein